MSRTTAVFCIILTLSVSTMAQDRSRHAGWFSSVNSITLNPKFRLQLDFAVRSTDKWEQVNTVFFRPGLFYNPDKNRSFVLGLNYLFNRAVTAHASELVPETQLWQQFWYRQHFGRTNLTHRFSLEQRFVKTFYEENNKIKTRPAELVNRFRYWIRATWPLAKTPRPNHGTYAILQEEVFLNFGNVNLVNGKTFDQSRTYAGLGFNFSPQLAVEGGYQYRRLQGRGTVDFNDHIIQLTTFLRL